MITEPLHQFAQIFRSALINEAPEGPCARLNDALRYALEGEGKCIRPFLTEHIATHLGAQPHQSFPAGMAIEMVHIYSLIHDDLPAMDDDDMRRGRPTLHRAFDEATAILVGDSLQSLAFSTLATAKNMSAEQRVAMIEILVKAAGPMGMCAGQSLDLAGITRAKTLQDVITIAQHKTADMFAAACAMGAATAGKHELIQGFYDFGIALGILFQLRDDNLDETADAEDLGKQVGKDREAGKATLWTIPETVAVDQIIQSAHSQCMTHYEKLQEHAPPILHHVIDFAMQRAR